MVVLFAMLQTVKLQLEWKRIPPKRFRYKFRGKHSFQSQVFNVIEEETPATINIPLNSPCPLLVGTTILTTVSSTEDFATTAHYWFLTNLSKKIRRVSAEVPRASLELPIIEPRGVLQLGLVDVPWTFHLGLSHLSVL